MILFYVNRRRSRRRTTTSRASWRCRRSSARATGSCWSRWATCWLWPRARRARPRSRSPISVCTRPPRLRVRLSSIYSYSTPSFFLGNARRAAFVSELLDARGARGAHEPEPQARLDRRACYSQAGSRVRWGGPAVHLNQRALPNDWYSGGLHSQFLSYTYEYTGIAMTVLKIFFY